MTDQPPATPLPERPTVDVVIATAGSRPATLRTALAAVAAQTYPGPIVTTLVFDQCPVDESYAVPDPARPVHVVANEHHSPGLAGARNTGVDAGSGELVAFCDDDDEWLPTKVEKQVAALRAGEAPTSVTGIIVRYTDREVPRVPDPADLTVETLARNRVMEAHPSTVMVRRDALTGPIGPVDEAIPGSFGEDYDWILRAARVGGFAVVPEPLVAVLWGSSLFQRDWATIIAALDYLLDKHPELRADPRAHARILGQQAFARAAQGRRREAWRLIGSTLRTHPREKRVVAASVVALRLMSAERLLAVAHRRGRGI